MNTAKDVSAAFDGLGLEEKRAVREHVNAAIGVPVPPPSEDLTTALKELLIDVSVLGREEDLKTVQGLAKAFTPTAASLSAIEQKATALGKWWATAIGAGGSMAFVGSWLTWLGNYWTVASDAEQVAVIGSCAAFLVAITVSVAIIVSADLRARSTAAVGQYQARSGIAEAYLQTAGRSGGIRFVV